MKYIPTSHGTEKRIKRKYINQTKSLINIQTNTATLNPATAQYITSYQFSILVIYIYKSKFKVKKNEPSKSLNYELT